MIHGVNNIFVYGLLTFWDSIHEYRMVNCHDSINFYFSMFLMENLINVLQYVYLCLGIGHFTIGDRMKVLFINADCLTRNSSANLCHLAYINGLLNAGHDVTVLSADGKDYSLDREMKIPEDAKCYFIHGISLYEKFSLKKKQHQKNNISESVSNQSFNKIAFIKRVVVSNIKSMILHCYGVHGIYKTFIRKASNFIFNDQFDILISVSTPPASHLLAYKLIKNGNVKAKHWIQIWEDPWYSDVYGFNNKARILKEEYKLISFAEKICYVSPLTLGNQKKLFSKYAYKMFWQPLPFYYQNDNEKVDITSKKNYGYFGDYAPVSRNLKLFYEAAKEMKINVNICGNPNNLFSSTEFISIYPRMTLDKLKKIEEKTNVLVFLCNKKGGQIPGKIYQYSATNKIILFILDGTDEEKRVLKEYFSKFNRYVFCDNNIEDIKNAIKTIEENKFNTINNSPVPNFNPVTIVNNILKMVG